MSFRKSIALVFVSLLIATVAAAETYVVDKTHSEVGFRVRHIVSKVPGSFNQFSGTFTFDPAAVKTAKVGEVVENASVEFTIDASSIDTDNSDRDNHLRSQDFFWVEKHPELTFKSTKIQKIAGDNFDVWGTLTMRGIEKPVKIDVAFLGTATDPWGNDKAGFQATTKVNRKDFDMVWNKALDQGGTILGEEVSIEIDLELNKKK